MASSQGFTIAAVVVGLLTSCSPTPSPEPQEPENAPEDAPSEAAPNRAVTEEDIERNPGEPIEEQLMHRFPGVWVERTGGGLRIRIRGPTSILGNNEPLFVIDGVAVRPGPAGALFGINPFDIESIRVLTDPTDTAMYGVRGANGVIIIKTKEP